MTAAVSGKAVAVHCISPLYLLATAKYSVGGLTSFADVCPVYLPLLVQGYQPTFVDVQPMSRQTNSHDCGVYACATAAWLATWLQHQHQHQSMSLHGKHQA
jgi:hypothetical protein